jgi:hypothetical protein
MDAARVGFSVLDFGASSQMTVKISDLTPSQYLIVASLNKAAARGGNASQFAAGLAEGLLQGLYETDQTADLPTTESPCPAPADRQKTNNR